MLFVTLILNSSSKFSPYVTYINIVVSEILLCSVSLEYMDVSQHNHTGAKCTSPTVLVVVAASCINPQQRKKKKKRTTHYYYSSSSPNASETDLRIMLPQVLIDPYIHTIMPLTLHEIILILIQGA